MQPLNGVRVLDLTHVISGPYAGMILADLGAETIKIEPPGRGELARGLLANDPAHSLNGMGAYILTLNRNKMSLTLDLKNPAGQQLFYELVAKSDVVLDNFRAGVTERLHISHDHLAAINPRIITCSITGFGQSGPERDRPAFDMVAQAMGGGMSITGFSDGPPVRAGVPITDLGAGLNGVIGILAALVARQSSGRGQHVDIAMLDVQIGLLNYIATMYLLSGQVLGPMGNAHFLHVPYDAFPTQDGYLILAVIGDSFWAKLMEVVPAPDLNSPENRQQPGRWQNREQITRRLSQIFQTNSQAYWINRLSAAQIPCAPVNNLAQALSDPQVLARNMVIEIEHTEGGTYRVPGNPIKLSEMSDNHFCSAPTLGQHTGQILQQLLGKSEAEIAALQKTGVV